MVTGNPIVQLEVVQGRVKVLVQGHGSLKPKCWYHATLSLVGLSPAAHLVKNLVSLPCWDTLGNCAQRETSQRESLKNTCSQREKQAYRSIISSRMSDQLTSVVRSPIHPKIPTVFRLLSRPPEPYSACDPQHRLAVRSGPIPSPSLASAFLLVK